MDHQRLVHDFLRVDQVVCVRDITVLDITLLVPPGALASGRREGEAREEAGSDRRGMMGVQGLEGCKEGDIKEGSGQGGWYQGG